MRAPGVETWRSKHWRYYVKKRTAGKRVATREPSEFHAKGFKHHTMRVTTASGNPNRRTPRAFLDLVEKVIGKIKLDPAADYRKRYQFAKTNYDGRDKDGLLETWRGFGGVYVNPPYERGKTLPKW